MKRNEISFFDFEKIEIRVGGITQAEKFPEVKKASFKLWVGLGPMVGLLKTSAQEKNVLLKS